MAKILNFTPKQESTKKNPSEYLKQTGVFIPIEIIDLYNQNPNKVINPLIAWIDLVSICSKKEHIITISDKDFTIYPGEILKKEEYFMEIWSASKPTVSRFVSLLRKKGLITTQKIGKYLVIKITDNQSVKPEISSSKIGEKTTNKPFQKRFTYNNINNIYKYNNINETFQKRILNADIHDLLRDLGIQEGMKNTLVETVSETVIKWTIILLQKRVSKDKLSPGYIIDAIRNGYYKEEIAKLIETKAKRDFYTKHKASISKTIQNYQKEKQDTVTEIYNNKSNEIRLQIVEHAKNYNPSKYEMILRGNYNHGLNKDILDYIEEKLLPDRLKFVGNYITEKLKFHIKISSKFTTKYFAKLIVNKTEYFILDLKESKNK